MRDVAITMLACLSKNSGKVHSHLTSGEFGVVGSLCCLRSFRTLYIVSLAARQQRNALVRTYNKQFKAHLITNNMLHHFSLLVLFRHA